MVSRLSKMLQEVRKEMAGKGGFIGNGMLSLRVEPREQLRENDCGLACLNMAAGYYDRGMDQKKLIEEAEKLGLFNKHNLIDGPDLVIAGEEIFGLKVTGFSKVPKILESLINDGNNDENVKKLKWKYDSFNPSRNPFVNHYYNSRLGSVIYPVDKIFNVDEKLDKDLKNYLKKYPAIYLSKAHYKILLGALGSEDYLNIIKIDPYKGQENLDPNLDEITDLYFVQPSDARKEQIKRNTKNILEVAGIDIF